MDEHGVALAVGLDVAVVPVVALVVGHSLVVGNLVPALAFDSGFSVVVAAPLAVVQQDVAVVVVV